MTWQERFSSKMNRTSWKIAHDGDHPQIEDMDDLQSHLSQHHSGDYIGDLDDHEWFHLDPEGYNDFHHEHNWPIEDNQPDHFHTNDYEKLNIPDALPKSFASKASDLGIPEDEYERWHPDVIKEMELRKYDTVEALVDKFPNCDFCGKEAHYDSGTKYPQHHGAWAFTCDDCFKEHTPGKLGHGIGQRLTLGLDRFKNSMKKIADSGSLRGEGISGMIDPDEEVVGPQDLDSNATEVDKFPKSVGVFPNSSKIAHNDKHPWPQGIDELMSHIKSHHMPGVVNHADYTQNHAEYTPMKIRDVLEQMYKDPKWTFDAHNEIHKTNQEWHPGDIPRKPSHNHDDDLTEETSDLDNIETYLPQYITSSWKTANGGSQFGEPIDYGENRLQDVEDTSRLQSRFPLDTGKRNYSEQRADANPLTLRSWFTGDDVNGPWPHTKNLSGPLDFEPTDDQNQDSTGPITGSFQSRYTSSLNEDQGTYEPPEKEEPEYYPILDKIKEKNSFQERYAHFDDIVHPFPDEDSIRDHLSTHHFGENPVGDIYLRQSFQERPPLTNNELVREHLNFHYHDALNENPLIGKPGWVLDHNHDDDPKVNVPDDLAKLASLNITSSWHEAFVETFDTHPDEDTPDSLLNPADELKNGRPRANDLPNQSAQLVPGMLIDHDQMGGSGTASGSF